MASGKKRPGPIIIGLVMWAFIIIFLGVLIFDWPWSKRDVFGYGSDDEEEVKKVDLKIDLQEWEDTLKEKWAERSYSSLERAKMLLDTYPVIDGHNDFPSNLRKLVENDLIKVDFRDLRNKEPWASYNESHTDIWRLKEGHVGAQFWVAYTDCDSQGKDSVQQTLEQIDLIYRLTEKYPDNLKLCKSSKCILESRSEGKIASLIGIEGGHGIGSSPAVLRQLYKLGARYLTLTNDCNTAWADASPVDAGRLHAINNGLSEFGVELIKEMNRIGMMVDLSNVARNTMIRALKTSKAPVIFSHSGAKAVCNHHRNVGDDVLQLLKANGGILMVNFESAFLNCNDPWRRNATIDDVIKHIQHIRGVVGPDHIGIGGNYDGVDSFPRGLEDVSRYPYLFAKLIDIGWDIDGLKKFSFQNLVRVMKQVEAVSKGSEDKPMHSIISSSEMESKYMSMLCSSPKSLAKLYDHQF